MTTTEELQAYRDEAFNVLAKLVEPVPEGPSPIRSVFITQLLLFAAGAYREGSPQAQDTGFAGMALDIFRRLTRDQATLLDAAGIEAKTSRQAIELCRAFVLLPEGGIAVEVASFKEASVEGYAMLLMAVAQTVGGLVKQPGEDDVSALARVITAFMALAPGAEASLTRRGVS